MINIHTEQTLELSVEVKKGNSTEPLDLQGAEWALMLLDCDGKNIEVLDATLEEDGSVKTVFLANSLSSGVYGIKLLWRAETGNRAYYVEKRGVWSVDDDEPNPSTASTVRIKVSQYADTYGYDGLSAYELAVLKGYTTLPEDQWVIVGEKGDSAYQVAVKNGFVGTEAQWLASLKGEAGAAGPAGPAGAAGATGNSGYSGDISELEVVNNLTQGGATAALSAEQGKVLNESINGETEETSVTEWNTGYYNDSMVASGTSGFKCQTLSIKKGDSYRFVGSAKSGVSYVLPVRLFLNGVQVATVNGKDSNWGTFSTYEGTANVDVDTIAFSSYQGSSLSAKVISQGEGIIDKVDDMEATVTALNKGLNGGTETTSVSSTSVLSSWETGYYDVGRDKTFKPTSGYKASPVFKVNPNDTYSFVGSVKTGSSSIAAVVFFYDGVYVDCIFGKDDAWGTYSTYSGTIPNGVNQVRFCTYNGSGASLSLSITKKPLEERIEAEEYAMRHVELRDYIVKGVDDIVLPKKMYATVGIEKSIYPKNFGCTEGTSVVIYPRNINVCQRRGYMTPASAGNLNLVFSVWIGRTKYISKTIPCAVKAKQNPSSSKKILWVGDSISDYQNSAKYCKEIFDSIDSGVKPTFIGTRHTAGCPDESMAGWKVENFLGASSPFYNSTTSAIDFSNYGTANGVPDVVVIELGYNDCEHFLEGGSDESTVTNNFKTLISGMKTAWSCKFVVVLPELECDRVCLRDNVEKNSKLLLMRKILQETIYPLYSDDMVISDAMYCIDPVLGYPTVAGGASALYADANEVRYRDSTHPTATGCKEWAINVYPAILDALGL